MKKKNIFHPQGAASYSMNSRWFKTTRTEPKPSQLYYLKKRETIIIDDYLEIKVKFLNARRKKNARTLSSFTSNS